jgi:hypothetical protein
MTHIPPPFPEDDPPLTEQDANAKEELQYMLPPPPVEVQLAKWHDWKTTSSPCVFRNIAPPSEFRAHDVKFESIKVAEFPTKWIAPALAFFTTTLETVMATLVVSFATFTQPPE